MEKFMKKFLRSSIITSAILIILGLLLIYKTENTIMAISYVIGGVLIAIGALALIRYVKNGESPALRNELDIVYGIVTVIFGIIIFLKKIRISLFGIPKQCIITCFQHKSRDYHHRHKKYLQIQIDIVIFYRFFKYFIIPGL